MISEFRRWALLAVSMLAQATSAFFVHGIAFMIPELRGRHGLTLIEAGVVVAMPTIGTMLALIAWGAVVDRIGERRVLVVGTALTAAAGAGAALSDSMIMISAFLLLGGMAAASTNAASGRVVVGWFPAHRRGLAMGIRQMAQPLGVGLAAITVPTLALGYGLGAALWLSAALAVAAAVLSFLVVLDPARPERSDPAAAGQLANPYRSGGFLWRVHAVSVLLVVPQFMVWTFGLVWLIGERGWSPGAAGTLIAITQVLGALGRIAAGQLSDRVRSRMRPLRWVAIAAAVTMIMLAAADQLDSPVAVVMLVLATVITVADNGLAFTAIAERAGPFWSGRALGAQNTAQFLTASLVPPVLGAAITVLGYPLAFALTAVCPAIAVSLVPARQEELIS
ncbi:MFS transporter [Microlunatus parietis]|uniref:MFS family permease n=1 Tax=Microlunatus parietis TaxID=682979 RepID=A0A7Y9I7J5_9ACTN|nr:MFS transporter [Microlunatus parietis]NYE71756.1 MFS family permease [Microlunatus parietis]